jgi:hypothetical protein
VPRTLRRYLCFIAGLILPIVHRAAAHSAAAANPAVAAAENMSTGALLLWLMPVVVPLTWIRSFANLSIVSVSEAAIHFFWRALHLLSSASFFSFLSLSILLLFGYSRTTAFYL